jgi:hypothetical protein
VGAARTACRGWLARGVPAVAATALTVAGAAGRAASAGAATPAPGTVSTVAGGVGGPARATDVPMDATVDSSGNLVTADTGNNRVREVAG